ncbi:hypothetical protein Salat_1647000 [Sesamum alatum]|uniref:CCHC-type domain-containing protein n=1 Tax=Sesamum alatum TaxID=300844 RepID=A0AAE2CJK0_9LAMI|nr:hypothetical protein Salat_1647000 [Sesamum alatum]
MPGAWLDIEDIGRDISWYDTIRIRINLNITVPLKRALRLHMELGDELVVRFSYKRLRKFCYLCGKLGHIGQLCDLRFQEHFEDPSTKTPYGAWLRASSPIRRFGVNTNSVRPTYIWRGASNSGLLGTRRRGAHIFGDFRRVSVGSLWPEAAVGGSSVGCAAFQERVDKFAGRLVEIDGQEQASMGRRLVDQDSDSLELHEGPTECHGPERPATGPAHFRSARSISEGSMGSSLDPSETRPKSAVGPSNTAQPIPSLAKIPSNSPRISEIPCGGEFEVGGPSSYVPSLTHLRQILAGEDLLLATVCASSSIPLIGVPVVAPFEIAAERGVFCFLWVCSEGV